MLVVGTTVLIYSPPKSDLPYLSVIITPGEENYPLATPFDTAAEAEAFNHEMNLVLFSADTAQTHRQLSRAPSRSTA